MKKVLVFIPVINEFDNLKMLIPAILNHLPTSQILIIDDNSSDGTEDFCRDVQLDHPGRLEYFQRHGRLGIGTAHRDGLRYAVEREFDYAISMDGDLTHDPNFLNPLVDQIEADDCVDLIIGSRFLPGSEIRNWSMTRLLLTRVGHTVTRLVLGMVEDLSSGLRVHRVSRIPSKILSMPPRGFSYFPESAYIYFRSNLRIIEYPVKLEARFRGESKLSIGEAVKSVCHLIILGIQIRREHD